jgi:hypothetical protein
VRGAEVEGEPERRRDQDRERREFGAAHEEVREDGEAC